MIPYILTTFFIPNFLLLTNWFISITETVDLPSVHITSVNSHVCSKGTEFSSVANFSACFFARLSSSEGIVLAVRDVPKNESFFIAHKNKQIIMRLNDQEKTVSRKIHSKRWTHICVRVDNGTEVEIYINYIVEKWSVDTFKAMSEDLENAGTLENINSEENVTFGLEICFGDPSENGESMVGEISGLQLKHINETLMQRDYECLYYDNVTFEDFEYWQCFEMVRTSLKDSLHICMDTVQILIQDSFVSYTDHATTCKSLRGRLLLAEEMEVLSDNIKAKSLNVCKRRKMLANSQSPWIESDMQSVESLEDQCAIFEDKEIRHQSCNIETYCNVCVLSYYLQIRLFGKLSKFDRNYTLLLSDNNDFDSLSGSNSSEISLTKMNGWMLNSKLHNEKWVTDGQAFPLGRKNWKNVENQEVVVLTLTACSEDDFTCNDGDCLPFTKRCDTEVDCTDESDELECHHIETKSGYDTNKIPYPTDGSPRTTLKFFVRIYNIHDISTNDGKLILNILLIFFWEDPRLIIWNPRNDKEINCSSIWNPHVTMMSSQMILDHKQYRSSCKIRNYPREMAPSLTMSLKDPFMGRYSDGKNETLSYWHGGMVTMFCKLNLRKYPFGKQTCALDVFSDHNAMLVNDYKFVPSSYQDGYENNEVLYTGNKELGEYYLSHIHYELARKDTKIQILIELEALSGFHILNSFTPSFLICFISYGTFLFPISNFNERIMVSLTALLVLAALFTQASGSSIKTPYFKSLDIWFVILVIFCFMVVMVNIIINVYEDHTETPNPSTELNKYDINEINNGKKIHKKWKTSKKINTVAMILFALFFIIFILLYFLTATDSL